MNEAQYTPNERKLSLLALLVDAPASREDIYSKVYGGQSAASEKSFQRDRSDLKDQGYDIVENGEFFFLHHDLIGLDVTPCDMTMLRVAAGAFNTRDDDHKVVRRTITKLLGGGQPTDSNVQVRLDVPELQVLLDIASAMSQSSPIEVTYQSVQREIPATYVFEPVSLWTSLGAYYVTGTRLHADYGDNVDDTPTQRVLRVSRILSVTVLEPAPFHEIAYTPPLDALGHHDVTVILQADHGAHVKEQATQLDKQTYLLENIAFDEALDVLNQLGTGVRTDFQPYLERLEYLSKVGENA